MISLRPKTATLFTNILFNINLEITSAQKWRREKDKNERRLEKNING